MKNTKSNVVSVAICSLAAMTGCKADKPNGTAGATAKVVVAPNIDPATDTPVEVAGTNAVNDLPGSRNMEGVAAVLGKIAQEKTARPAVKVTVEQVHQTLSQNGIELQSITQVFAGLVGASYCVNGTSLDGVIVAVCEFVDEKRAQKGEEFIIKNYASFTTDAVRKIHQSTLVTVVNGTVAKATQDKIVKSLSNL